MLNIATTAAPIRNLEPVDDDAYIAALDYEYLNARSIARRMRTNGTPATLGAIRAQMAEFVRESGLVEVEGDSWRIVPPTPANDNGNDLPPPPPVPSNDIAPLTRKARRAAKVVETFEATPANDNPATVLPIGLHQMCGLELMRSLPDASVDLVLADLPYGVTKNGFDPKIDADEWMREMARIVTRRGSIVAFASLDFTRQLLQAGHHIAPNFAADRVVWDKPHATGQQLLRHMQAHEDILIFSHSSTVRTAKSVMIYNPQGTIPMPATAYGSSTTHLNARSRKGWAGTKYTRNTNWPRSVLRYGKDQDVAHPFAKPVALLEYLIRTYTNDGAVVLDPTMGSGSTGVACLATGRPFIGAEKGYDKHGACIFTSAIERIAAIGDTSPAANDDAKQPKPKPKPVVTPKRRREPVIQPDEGPLPMIIPAFTIEAANDTETLVPPPAPSNDNITPTVVGDATLYQADCLAAMRAMPSESVDVIFTSPPYNLRESKSGRGDWNGSLLRKGYETHTDDMPREVYVAWQKEVLTECWRLLKPSGAIFYNHKQRGVRGKYYDPRDLNPGLQILQSIIWDRKAGHNPTTHRFLPTHEEILIFAKPHFRLRSDKTGTKTVWDVTPETRKNTHEAPFPVELVMKALDSTTGSVVFDPFMGSGTTGVAALRAGRQFVGVEIGPKTFAGAVERIAAEAAYKPDTLA